MQIGQLFNFLTVKNLHFIQSFINLHQTNLRAAQYTTRSGSHRTKINIDRDCVSERIKVSKALLCLSASRFSKYAT